MWGKWLIWYNFQIAMEHVLRDAANHLGRTSATGHVELAADAATACHRELLVTKKCVPAITIKPPTEEDASALKSNSRSPPISIHNSCNATYLNIIYGLQSHNALHTIISLYVCRAKTFFVENKLCLFLFIFITIRV
jgi:hypothetical protein